MDPTRAVDWAELNHRVTQRIFAAGLALAARPEDPAGPPVHAVERAVGELDAVLRELGRLHVGLEAEDRATEARWCAGLIDAPPDAERRPIDQADLAVTAGPLHLVPPEAAPPSWFEHSLDAVLLTVPDTSILAANPAACEVLGLTEAQITARPGPYSFRMEDDREWALALAERSRRGHVHADLSMCRGNGDAFMAGVSSTMFTASDGSPRALVMFRDLSVEDGLRRQLAHTTHELHRLALEDDLTGLANRRGFYRDATQMLANADREVAAVHAAYIDIHDFKRINDRLGHRAGDAALVAVADTFRSCIRTVDLAARVGGDEFLILFYRADRTHVEEIMRRITEQLADRDRSPVPVTLDWGLAERPAGSFVDIDRLVRESDLAMYERKRIRPSVIYLD